MESRNFRTDGGGIGQQKMTRCESVHSARRPGWLASFYGLVGKDPMLRRLHPRTSRSGQPPPGFVGGAMRARMELPPCEPSPFKVLRSAAESPRFAPERLRLRSCPLDRSQGDCSAQRPRRCPRRGAATPAGPAPGALAPGRTSTIRVAWSRWRSAGRGRGSSRCQAPSRTRAGWGAGVRLSGGLRAWRERWGSGRLGVWPSRAG